MKVFVKHLEDATAFSLHRADPKQCARSVKEAGIREATDEFE
jgi:hypothetical protein